MRQLASFPSVKAIAKYFKTTSHQLFVALTENIVANSTYIFLLSVCTCPFSSALDLVLMNTAHHDQLESSIVDTSFSLDSIARQFVSTSFPSSH